MRSCKGNTIHHISHTINTICLIINTLNHTGRRRTQTNCSYRSRPRMPPLEDIRPKKKFRFKDADSTPQSKHFPINSSVIILFFLINVKNSVPNTKRSFAKDPNFISFSLQQLSESFYKIKIQIQSSKFKKCSES